MSRSRRNRAAQSGNRRRAFSSGDIMARRDLIVGGGFVNNSGVQVASSTWAGSPVGLTPAGQIAWQAVVLPQAVTAINAPPSVGECVVQDIEGSMFLSNPTAPGIYYVGVGIYISKFDSRTGTWNLRSIVNTTTDAARDDWLMLRALVMTLPLTTGVTDSMELEIRLALIHPIVLGGGEALHVAIDSSSLSPGNLNVAPFFRTRISDVT